MPISTASQHKFAAAEYSEDEHVEVRIEGNIWVAGVVVAVMSVMSKFLDARYEVSYRLRGGTVVREFDAECVRPASPHGAPQHA